MEQSPISDIHKSGHEKLRQILSQEDTVLFIGSGISSWSGLPTWPRLVEELALFIEAQGISAKLVRAEASKNDLIQAASYGIDLLTKPQFAEFVRKTCRLGTARPHEIHKRIVELGPRCFITTNYDPLLEEALRQWQPERFFRVVSNRQITETADIVQARAIDFVFKPHGDASDSDSVIMSREQYRILHGEKRHVLEAVETFFISRPIVYFGFGLKDPDFIFIKDLIANTYKGGARDHYAVVADITEEEKPYWRKNYGIHLISYLTKTHADGCKDHSPLIELLDNFIQPHGRIPDSTAHSIPRDQLTKFEVTPQLVLSLARYGGRVAFQPQVDSEIPLHVTRKASKAGRGFADYDQYAHASIERFLSQGPNRALLVGLPGAGKTYSFKRTAAKIGERLQEVCLSDSFDRTKVVIPFYVDLKFFTGSILEMVERTLPPDLSVDRLIQEFETRLFIDSFNEMPREQLDAGRWEQDFTEWIQRLTHGAVIFGSRLEAGLEKLNLPVYELDSIQLDYVQTEIARHGIRVEGRFQQEILSLFQKPLFFRLFVSERSLIPRQPHPTEIYRSYFEHLSNQFSDRFGVRVDLSQAFRSAAFRAIDNGDESIPLSELEAVFKHELATMGATGANETEGINWLISKTFLVPQVASRLTFFHQSITEYLGAVELARLYSAEPTLLRQKLKFTRWDQSLFLALRFLNHGEAAAFVNEVISTDLALAIQASKYVEGDSTELVTEILMLLIKKPQLASFEHRNIHYALEQHLIASNCHEELLKKLIAGGNTLGGAVAVVYGRLKGEVAKETLIGEIFSKPDDFNFCSSVGGFLSNWIGIGDVPALIEKIAKFPAASANNQWHGLVVGVAAMLESVPVEILEKSFGRSNKNSLSMTIFCTWLYETKSPESCRISAALVARGIDEAIFSLYMNLRFAKDLSKVHSDIFTEKHCKMLFGAFNQKSGPWALGSLKLICELRPDLRSDIKRFELDAGIAAKIALRYCLEHDNETVWEALWELAKMPQAKLLNQPFHLLNTMDLNWSGHEDLLVTLLRKRFYSLAYPILEQLLDSTQPLILEIESPDWCLEWLSKLRGEERFWLGDRLGHLLSRAVPKKMQALFIAEFNKKDSSYRAILATLILPKFRDLTTDEFAEDAVSFLLAQLNKSAIDSLLGKTATESFVLERLLPLLSSARGRFRSNLMTALKQAGDRHGRRYVDDEML